VNRSPEGDSKGFADFADAETNRQVVFFDLPRLSALQFNVSTEEVSDRAGLVAKIRRAITERAEAG